MPASGKQSVKSLKPSPNPTTVDSLAAWIPAAQESQYANEADAPGSQPGLRAYLKNTKVEKTEPTHANAAHTPGAAKAIETADTYNNKARKKALGK